MRLCNNAKTQVIQVALKIQFASPVQPPVQVQQQLLQLPRQHRNLSQNVDPVVYLQIVPPVLRLKLQNMQTAGKKKIFISTKLKNT